MKTPFLLTEVDISTFVGMIVILAEVDISTFLPLLE